MPDLQASAPCRRTGTPCSVARQALPTGRHRKSPVATHRAGSSRYATDHDGH
jgi:hypothetical protein